MRKIKKLLAMATATLMIGGLFVGWEVKMVEVQHLEIQ